MKLSSRPRPREPVRIDGHLGLARPAEEHLPDTDREEGERRMHVRDQWRPVPGAVQPVQDQAEEDLERHDPEHGTEQPRLELASVLGSAEGHMAASSTSTVTR
jgi:hypothetical protein